jgi:hypothetical protein
MVESILCLLFCGGVFAIPAIIYASQVNGHLARGDYQSAMQASKTAKTWCISLFAIFLTLNLCTIGFVFMMLIMGAVAGAN